ncbi:MAG: hypothetical protein J5794_09015 [Lachnospiraceae bacterium]|nr:hypothetical protein [Lachnospiraceae bacterium]
MDETKKKKKSSPGSFVFLILMALGLLLLPIPSYTKDGGSVVLMPITNLYEFIIYGGRAPSGKNGHTEGTDVYLFGNKVYSSYREVLDYGETEWIPYDEEPSTAAPGK